MREHQPSPTHIDAGATLGAIVSSTEFQRNQEAGYPTQRALARTALELTGMDSRTGLEDSYEIDTNQLDS